MRPLGVTFVGYYQILRGVIGLVFGLFVVFYDGPSNKLVSVAALGNGAERLVGHFGHGGGLFVIAFAIVHLLAAYGLLGMQNWGRFLTLVFCALELVLVLPRAIHANIFSLIFGGLNAVCIIYLAMPATRRVFLARPSREDRFSGSAARV
jgi:hypothetical protein